MELYTQKTIIVVFNPKIDTVVLDFRWHDTYLRRELFASYLRMLFFATGKFHQARKDRISKAVKLSYSIQSKAINRHFLHTLPIREYYFDCLLPKVNYACSIWAIGCSKDGWREIEKVQKDYFKTHFNLHLKVCTAVLLAELRLCPIEVEALISTIQMVQGLYKLD